MPGGVEITPFGVGMKGRVRHGSLTTEAIQGAALPLQCVYNIEGSDGLAARVLSVGDSISDDILQKDLQAMSPSTAV